MDCKRFIPCIYLYRTNAVRTLTDFSVVDTDPVRLARRFSDNNADELIIFDMSESDAEHEEALDIIKEICNTVAIPVIGAGNVHRMEDIKKLLYAGCKRAILDYDNPENVSINSTRYTMILIFTLNSVEFIHMVLFSHYTHPLNLPV